MRTSVPLPRPFRSVNTHGQTNRNLTAYTAVKAIDTCHDVFDRARYYPVLPTVSRNGLIVTDGAQNVTAN